MTLARAMLVFFPAHEIARQEVVQSVRSIIAELIATLARICPHLRRVESASDLTIGVDRKKKLGGSVSEDR
jgi:hypothetical protein